MDLITPPTLNDSRISSLVATMPLVEMGGVAGPVVAACTRTGVGFDATRPALCCRTRRHDEPERARCVRR